MLPAQLTPEEFKTYPPQARDLAVTHLALLRRLPLCFAPFLLKEIIGYDWKFPVEQTELDHQLTYLEQSQPSLSRFERLQLAANADAFNWVQSPAQFLEQLSAHLWATHQIDEFRAASEQYIHQLYASLPERPLPAARLAIVVIGQEAQPSQYPLFRKLRHSGVYFTRVNPEKGLPALLEAVKARAAAHPEPYAHWYIDGGEKGAAFPEVATVSYAALNPVRSALAEKMRAAYESPKFDPELLRTTLAQASPEALGLSTLLQRFELSLLTEGSGTQIYSTTFVQWAAREALRRAQPLTLLARYAPRQKERSMSDLLNGSQQATPLDPQGSLIDADMGAYYTWLNQQRLSGAANSRFLAWFENSGEALAIAPGLQAASVNHTPINLSALLQEYILKV